VSMSRMMLVRLEAGEVIEAENYTQAHDIARYLLGLRRDDPPQNCAHCGISELELGGLVSQMHAALDWRNTPPERLRTDYKNCVFSIRPDLDYIALCASCNHKYDSNGWKPAPPLG